MLLVNYGVEIYHKSTCIEREMIRKMTQNWVFIIF